MHWLQPVVLQALPAEVAFQKKDDAHSHAVAIKNLFILAYGKKHAAVDTHSCVFWCPGESICSDKDLRVMRSNAEVEEKFSWHVSVESIALLGAEGRERWRECLELLTDRGLGALQQSFPGPERLFLIYMLVVKRGARARGRRACL